MRSKRLIACLAMLLVLPGCWDIKDLQTINYITSIGLDYKQGKFIMYAQMVDFTSVAKQETGKVSEPAGHWVGKGTGETINLAANDLYSTMQQRTFWSHVDTIVVSSSFLKQEMVSLTDALFRFREIRYTPWIYGTNDSIEDIFITPGFFNLNTLATILSEPMENYKQKSIIAPMQYVHYISEAREPDKTILLPSLAVNREQWKRNEKSEKKLIINGVFALQNQSFKGWFDTSSVIGLRWMESATVRSPLAIAKAGKTEAVISMGKPKIDIKLQERTDPPRFSVQIKIDGNLIEAVDPLTEAQLIEKAQQQIEKEIRSTYEAGLKTKADLFSLEHVLYHDHYPLWKKLHASGRFFLDRDSLQSIQVKVNVSHSGMLRTHPREVPPEKTF